MDTPDSRRSSASPDANEPDPDAVSNAIRARGEEIKRRELERAFDRLEAHGTLTERQRRAVTCMATAIVEGVVRTPDAALTDATEHDHDAVRTAIELFDPNR